MIALNSTCKWECCYFMPLAPTSVPAHRREGKSASLPHCAKALALPVKDVKAIFDTLVKGAESTSVY
jgi:hypothetical protein